MLMILIQWCYFAVTAFLTGFALLTPFQRKGGYRIRHVTSHIMAGLLALNVYAGYFSLFAGVGLSANIAVMVFDAASAVILRERIASFFRDKKKETGWKRMLLYGFLVILFSYGSSRGYMHYDTGLYHAQAIRWIEEYGVVPGLANLHSRFGYNSAAFALCALFGGAGMMKYPMHCVPGFFALICAVKCASLLELPGRKRVRLSDFLYMGCIFYLVAVFRELVSPASDYFAMLILFFTAMTWVELLERREKEILPYGLLSLYLVYAVTVKLSAAVLLVLALYPGIMLIAQKKWKQIAGYIGLGLLIAFPYLARNVLISGWLFYPFTFLDIFPVDWKISKGYADSDAFEIQVYAKGIYDVYQKDMPFLQWFPSWLNAQAATDRLLVVAAWLSAPVGAVFTAVNLFGACRKRKAGSGRKMMGGGRRNQGPETAGMEMQGFVLLEAAALLGFFFWQFGAPLVRYGYFYVLFLPLVTLGAIYVHFWGKGKGFRIFAGLLVAFLLYRSYNLFNMVIELSDQPYYIFQQDYADYPADTYEVDGITVWVPHDRGQIGYYKFPSSPVAQDIELRGQGIESGFRKK